jgi:hypothetical protein
MSAKLFSSASNSHLLGAWRHSIPSGRMSIPPSLHVPNSRRLQTFPYSTQTSKSPTPTPPSPKPNPPPENPSLPSFNLLQQIRASRPAIRYTVYAGLGLMVTVESTFWFHVLKAKFFPSQSAQEKVKSQAFMSNVEEAIVNSRAAWMGNYGRYYAGYVWGVGER